MPQYLWDAITYPCSRYLPLALTSRSTNILKRWKQLATPICLREAVIVIKLVEEGAVGIAVFEEDDANDSEDVGKDEQQHRNEHHGLKNR